ncbi:MAG TPA: ABC transporter permease, partial [Longimicrobiales bacterium]|nr:ABC transporter permease [Longimicrobiales bacterium]
MQRLLQDLRFAMRRLRRTPGFTLIAVLSLALGIGANTAIFSLVQAVLLRDPPVREPERVVEVYLHSSDYAYVPFSIPDFREFQRASAQVFSTSFGSVLTLVARDRGDQVETLPAEMVTGDYFETLGLAPAYGRLLTRTDDVSPGAHAVVVLSWDYWQRAFQGDLAAVGQALRLNGRAYTIVGIAPREYEGNLRTLAPALYVPIMMVNQLQPSGFDQLAERGDHSMFVRARLRPGATLARAEAMLQSFAGDMKTRFRDHWPQNVEIRSVVLADLILNPMLDRYVMLAAGLLSVVVGLVLLIACANLASFLLAQARDRRREIAIKLALGSGRDQLVRQLLTESIALSLIGGACALVLAKGLLGLLLNTDLPLPLPITVKATLDPAVLLFALAVSLVAGVLFGLAPALQTTRADVVSTIKNENTGGGPRRRLNLRNTLVVGQVAVSLVLLVTAGLFLRSLANRRMIDPGFGAEPTAVIQIGISAERYTPAEARLLVKRMEAQVGAIPGVQAAGVTGNIHLNTLSTQTMGVTVEGFEPPPGRREFDIDRARVDPGFFSAAGIPIQRGRNFDDALDLDGAPRVAIVNQVLADKFWPG